MKFRVLPVVIAVLASSVILFGGWFAYHSYAMESPISQIIDHSPGVEQVKSDFSKDTVTVQLKLAGDASIREIYQKLTTEGSSVIGKRELKLKLDSQSSPEIEQWWSSALFDVAQAMETRHYSDIPKILDDQKSKLPGLTAATEMDEKNVYVRLSDGGKNKYIILPRVPAVMGAWSNNA